MDRRNLKKGAFKRRVKTPRGMSTTDQGSERDDRKELGDDGAPD